MAGTKEIKRRIKSIKNTKKITKAMELVAASKMKRAVSSTLASRLYAEYSWQVLTSIAKNIEEHKSPLFEAREIKNILLVLITSNRGLCGAYNAQIIKKALAIFRENSGVNVSVLAIGKRGDAGIRRVGQNIVATFTELPDNVELSDVLPISKLINDEYINKTYDQVLVAYTDFKSALVQKPNIKQILPVSKAIIEELKTMAFEESIDKGEVVKEEKIDYVFEGDVDRLTEMLAEKITRMQMYQMILESNASEQSARMIAMKNASEASGEMIDDLTLVFNKARQSNITREISEISAGMASVS